MVILMEKGIVRFPWNLLIRAAAYDKMRTCTVLPLHQIKTVKREMNRRKMGLISNTPGDDY